MKISRRLRQQFCRDMEIPIKIFESPEFEERLELFDRRDDYIEFVQFINYEFRTEEDFFTYYNQLKNDIIRDIKQSDAYRRLNEFNMTGESIYCFHDIKKGDVYKENNIGRTFISIDIEKANFFVMAALKNMKGSQLPCFEDLKPKTPDDYNYEKFIKRFTPYSYFTKSKYLRQVVFGNCNPKRQMYVEKHLISIVLRKLINDKIIKKDDIYSINSDEAILWADKENSPGIKRIADFLKPCPVPLKIERFTLGKFRNTNAYIKTARENMEELLPDQYKCLNPYEAPFIYRFMKNEYIRESDQMFIFEGKMARLCDIPDVSLDLRVKPEVAHEKDPGNTDMEDDGILFL